MRRSIAAIALTIVGVAATACHNPDSYGLSPTNVDAFLSLTPSSTSVAADGNSRVTLTAAIDPRATAGNRTIKFSTNAGSLIAAGQRSTTSIDVVADAGGKAVAELQANTAVLTCRVQAQIRDFVRTVDIKFTPPNPDDVLLLAVAAETIPADGFSRSRLTATVKLTNDPSQRVVTFKTSAGLLFAAPGGGGSKSVDVPTDNSGVAIADLQSSSSIEPAFVSVTAAGVTRATTIEFVAPDPHELITLTASAATMPADGATLVQVTATIAAGLPNASRTVTFNTSADSVFVLGGEKTTVTVAPDASNRAIVDLKALKPTTVHVNATVANVSASVLIAAVVALPDNIFVTAANGTVSSIGVDTINVTLLRSIGVPTPGQIVSYSAKDPTGNPVGVFSNVQLSTTNGTTSTSSAVYNPAGTSYRGPVNIQVTVAGTITAMTVIQIGP